MQEIGRTKGKLETLRKMQARVQGERTSKPENLRVGLESFTPVSLPMEASEQILKLAIAELEDRLSYLNDDFRLL